MCLPLSARLGSNLVGTELLLALLFLRLFRDLIRVNISPITSNLSLRNTTSLATMGGLGIPLQILAISQLEE